VKFDKEKIMPVCLPTSDEISSLEPVGKWSWVTGWGYTNPSHSPSQILQKIELMIEPLEFCNKIIPKASGKASDRNLCVGTLNRWKDAAGGDSGGLPKLFFSEK
jgi:secreted trypsin-like serine protease